MITPNAHGEGRAIRRHAGTDRRTAFGTGFDVEGKLHVRHTPGSSLF
jgi:hypothetical protein